MCPPSLFMESWRTWRFLMNLEMVPYDMFQPSEVVVKIWSKSNTKNPVKTQSVLQVPCLESWRTWWFLTNQEMESYDKDQPSEASVKVSSRFNMMYSYFFEKGEIIGLFSPKVNIMQGSCSKFWPRNFSIILLLSSTYTVHYCPLIIYNWHNFP